MSTENSLDVNNQQVQPNSGEFREVTTYNPNAGTNTVIDGTAATTTDSSSIE
jgi:hypothetical protein